MPTWNKDIQQIEQKHSDKGSWITGTEMNAKGEIREYNYFGKVAETITQNGIGGYAIEFEKTAKGWDAISATPLSQVKTNGESQEKAKSIVIQRPRELDPNIVYQCDSISAQVCIKSAAEIVSAKEHAFTPDDIAKIAERLMLSSKLIHKLVDAKPEK